MAEMKSIAAGLERKYPDSNRGNSASVIPLSDAIVGNIRPILLVLQGGAGLLLLIACVNVSSLMLVRAESRRREIAVRGALGASRVRLSRQFVTEAVTLVVAGSAMGLGLAYGGMKGLSGLMSKTGWTGCRFARAGVESTRADFCGVPGCACGDSVFDHAHSAFQIFRHARWIDGGRARVRGNAMAADGREPGGD